MNILEKKQEKIKDINTHGKTGTRGYSEFISFLSEKKISPLQAIKAECYDCMGYYADGVGDCDNPMCPLYPYMPFSPKVKDPVKVEAGKRRAALTGFGIRKVAEHDKTS